MPPKSDPEVETAPAGESVHAGQNVPESKRSQRCSRNRYLGTLLFNLATLTLPALYSTLSKLWVANIDASMVVTIDAATYMGVISLVVNDGLPRAVWNTIADKANRSLAERLSLSYTLILFQTVLGVIMSTIFASVAQQFANIFVPVEVRGSSLTYVRISAFGAISSTIEAAVAAATRALDQPDVPLVINSAKFAINIILDMIIISKFHVNSITPTVNTQAAIHLACELAAAFVGLAYFVFMTRRRVRQDQAFANDESLRPSWRALKVLARPGVITFIEAAIQQALYLWLVSGIISMGSDYATAWGVFSTMRWGLIMVPVSALELTSLTFVGHEWGAWRNNVGTANRRPTANTKQLITIAKPALISCAIALAVEVSLCLFMSFYGARHFAYYLSGSSVVGEIAEEMWKSIDWCYIFYALFAQLATILLASRPRWYLYQSLISHFLWVLPWAIVVTRVEITPTDAWKYHSIIFGGVEIFNFVDIVLVDLAWARILCKGEMLLPPFSTALNAPETN